MSQALIAQHSPSSQYVPVLPDILQSSKYCDYLTGILCFIAPLFASALREGDFPSLGSLLPTAWARFNRAELLTAFSPDNEHISNAIFCLGYRYFKNLPGSYDDQFLSLLSTLLVDHLTKSKKLVSWSDFSSCFESALLHFVKIDPSVYPITSSYHQTSNLDGKYNLFHILVQKSFAFILDLDRFGNCKDAISFALCSAQRSRYQQSAVSSIASSLPTDTAVPSILFSILISRPPHLSFVVTEQFMEPLSTSEHVSTWLHPFIKLTVCPTLEAIPLRSSR